MTSRTALYLVVLTAALAGCSSSSTPSSRSDGDTPGPSGVSPSDRATAPVEPVGTIHSKPLPNGYVRLPVASADLTHTVRLNRKTIEALATGGAFSDEVDPAISTNDGASWIINGPRFAATPATSANHLVVSTDRTLIAWEHASRVVQTRRFGVRRWSATTFAAGLRSLSISGRRLIVTTQRVADSTTPTTYSSADDGATWTPGITTSS